MAFSVLRVNGAGAGGRSTGRISTTDGRGNREMSNDAAGQQPVGVGRATSEAEAASAPAQLKLNPNLHGSESCCALCRTVPALGSCACASQICGPWP
jgi:hypothetical protein